MRALLKYLALPITGAVLLMATAPSDAINLQGVYRQAVNNDQTLKISLGQLRQDAELSPQAWSYLLPKIEATGMGTLSKSYRSGDSLANTSALSTTTTNRDLDYGITLNQALFDSALFSGLKVANNQVKASYAAFQASQQDLINRTIQAYLNVLQQEDLVTYAKAEKRALYEQYRQAAESFKVGVTTITDVYQAKAAYDGSTSRTIAAKNDLENAFEALRVITGTMHRNLTPLSEQFPLISPDPANINKWVGWTNKNNATIAQYRYLSQAAKYTIRAQWGQHLPTVNAQLGYAGQHYNTIAEDSDGTFDTRTPSAAISVTVPIFEGGLVTSQVREAAAAYEQAQASLELTRREAVESARKAYLAVVSGVSQVKADRRTIISDKSSLDATMESYKVGTMTMVDVLDAQQQLYEDLSTYATDRYAYVGAIISLKEAAGTLNSSDIIKLNSWMTAPIDNKTELDRLDEYAKRDQEKMAKAMAADVKPVNHSNTTP